MSLTLKRGTSWWETYARCVEVAPEAFDSDRLRNLVHGEWRRVGTPGDHVTPIDGTPIPGPPRIDFDSAVEAVAAACQEHQDWAKVDLEERQQRVTEAVDALTAHRDLLALLLVWEIGKPWRLACADVDRALDGVRWYVGEIERQLTDRDGQLRTPLPGPVSNIASWNYPMSVQVHAELVQAARRQRGRREDPEPGRLPLPDARPRADAPRRAAGHAASRGSGASARRGADPQRGPRARWPSSAAVRTAARPRSSLADTGRRHLLEQEGLNTWGIWDFSDWDQLAAAPAQGLRVRQAALHGLPALRACSAA